MKFIVTIFVVATAVVLWLQPWSKPAPASSYVELRVIDENGRAVPGAKVVRDGIAIGNTDSYGEWRRTLLLSTTTPVVFDVSKVTDAGVVRSVRHMIQPADVKQTLRMSVKLALMSNRR